MAVAIDLRNPNKRIRSDASSMRNAGESLYSSGVDTWLNTSPISKQIVSTCNAYRSIYASLNSAKNAMEKLNEHVNKGTIPPSLRRNKPLSLPDGCEEEQHKATQTQSQYEKEMLSLVVSARKKEVEKWETKMKSFFDDQKALMKSIIEHEQSVLASSGISPVATVDQCLHSFMTTVENRIRDLISEITIKQFHSKKKEQEAKVDRMVEEEKVFNNPEKSIRELVKQEVLKHLKKGGNVSSTSKPTPKTTPSNSSKKKNNSSSSSKNKTKSGNKHGMVKSNSNKSKHSSSNRSQKSKTGSATRKKAPI